ncbi:MAG: alpha/beta hydrolase [Spirochaetaceae bacterium]|nr:MAG: alpha/beta hydrolase [Spirochaetaceae bacterium]
MPAETPEMSGLSGYFRCGLPYNRSGRGARALVIFPGLTFENKPQFGMLSMYAFLKREFTLFAVNRRPGMPSGCTLRDMGDDYATMIREEFGGPVDVIGISTGGSIALHFAADHPDLVRRLVIHSSAHTLNDAAKALQLEVARLAQKGEWRQAWATIVRTIFPQKGPGRWLSQPLVGFSAWLLSRKPPRDPGDLVATVRAEDEHAFKDRLGEIAAPTLVAGGADDFFYSPSLFGETAAGIPNSRLCLYEKMGHPATGWQFRSDVLTFLRDQ